MKKVFVVLGQTATGKSDLAVKIALRLSSGQTKKGAEIISADSRQVYKGLDIGTGKITKKEMRGVLHHLLDIISPKKRFSVSEYQKLANFTIVKILNKGKTPIICGGTGFYIDAVTKGIVLPKVPPNPKLRARYTQKAALALFQVLKKLDPKRAKNIDPHNKVRLIRAIEIAKYLGKVPSVTEETPPFKFIKLGLFLPKDKLKIRIEKRVKFMFKKGLLREIRKLKKFGVSEKRLRELGFEYYNPTPEKVIKETHKYAKRQMTWFKRDKSIKWFDASKKINLTRLPTIQN